MYHFEDGVVISRVCVSNSSSFGGLGVSNTRPFGGLGMAHRSKEDVMVVE